MSDQSAVKTDESSPSLLEFFKEEAVDGAVYNVYLKKVHYHTSPDHANNTSDVQQPSSTDLLDDKKGHLQWRLEEVRVIKVGTLDRLVEALCSDTGELDTTFVNMFLATYRSFTTPQIFIQQVLKRYRDVGDQRMSQSVREACRRSIRTLLLVWLDTYVEDFREPPTYRTLTLLHEFAASNMPDSELFQRSAEWMVTFRREEDFTSSFCEPVHDLAKILRRSVLENAMSNGPRNGGLVSPVDMLIIPDKLFAEQLTYVDAELFKKVITHHCLGSVWSRRTDKKYDSQPLTVYATVDQFNSVSYRVIATILKHPYANAVDHAAVIEKWIGIAQECRILKNFSSLKAIIAGLQSTSVFRLKKVWQHVSRERMMLYEELAEIFCEDNNQSALRELINREGTAKFADTETIVSSTLRASKVKSQMLKSWRQPGSASDSPSNTTTMQGTVPYLGTFLTDLTMIDTAFKDFVRDSAGIINFDKKRREFEIIAQIQMLQSTAGLYRIEPDSVFFDWFYRLRVYDDNESYELSHVIEPSNQFATVVHRRGHRKNASLGFFSSPQHHSSVEDIWCRGDSSPYSRLRDNNEDDTRSVASMQDYYLNSDRPKKSPKFHHSLSMCSVKSMFDISTATTEVSLLVPPMTSSTSSSPTNSTEGLPVKVYLHATENHHTNHYKSILLMPSDHSKTVLSNVLSKYGVTSKRPDDFCIIQLLPDKSELVLPSHGNIFYAIKKDVPEIKFVVRRLDSDKLKLKNMKHKSRLSRLIF